MNLKELYELVQQWSRWGLKSKCVLCDGEITVRPEDRAVVCVHCENTYPASSVWLQYLIDLL